MITLNVISREKIMEVFYNIYILAANCCFGTLPEIKEQSPESPEIGKEAGHAEDILDCKVARVP